MDFAQQTACPMLPYYMWPYVIITSLLLLLLLSR